jgi:hypothetical protein
VFRIRGEHFNVLRAIVCLIIVQVVGNFLWPKRATELLCRNKTVFADIPMLVCIRMVWHPQQYVTVIVNPSAAFPEVVIWPVRPASATPHRDSCLPKCLMNKTKVSPESLADFVE